MGPHQAIPHFRNIALTDNLRPGDIIPVKVCSITALGIFCDAGGCGALMRLERCCISRLKQGTDLFAVGQEIPAAVLMTDHAKGLIHLTGRELLGTWDENAEHFRQGQILSGTVRSKMPYGLFIELLPNLCGLAEPTSGIAEGDPVSVQIRALLCRKHKIKLTILEKLPAPLPRKAPEFFITSGHIGKWEYYPGSRAVTCF